MAEGNGNGAKSQIGPFLSFIGQAWPVLVFIGGLIWASSQVLHTVDEMNKRLDDFDVAVRRRDDRISTLEKQAGVADERLSGYISAIANIQRLAEQNRNETRREHDELLSLLYAYISGGKSRP